MLYYISLNNYISDSIAFVFFGSQQKIQLVAVHVSSHTSIIGVCAHKQMYAHTPMSQSHTYIHIPGVFVKKADHHLSWLLFSSH